MERMLINWVISALILWLLSLLPFMAMSFDGIVAILIAAIVIGLINALIVPAVKSVFKTADTLLLLVVSLVVDAAALWLAGLLVPGFGIEFFPTAIIAAAVLTVLNLGFDRDINIGRFRLRR